MLNLSIAPHFQGMHSVVIIIFCVYRP